MTGLNSYRPQRSCGKVMFSGAFVILFKGGAAVSQHALVIWDIAPYPVHAGIHTPPAATTGDGTHPTGMRSCLVPESSESKESIYGKLDRVHKK